MTALRELHEAETGGPFSILIGTILSARTRDENTTKIVKKLFARYPDAASLAGARLRDVERIVRPIGFYHVKARRIVEVARIIRDEHGGAVPDDLETLVSLPGVGRKTANVIRSVALGLPGLPVDTHVTRLSGLLGLTAETDPVRIEEELNPMIPAAERGDFSLRMILHGRRVCIARRPRCEDCLLNDFCPSSAL